MFESADSNTSFRTRSGGATRTANQIPNAIRTGNQAVGIIKSDLRTLNQPKKKSGGSYHASFLKQARRKTRKQGEAGLLLEQISLKLSEPSLGIRQGQGGRDSSAVNFGTDISVVRQLGSDCSANTVCPSQNR